MREQHCTRREPAQGAREAQIIREIKPANIGPRLRRRGEAATAASYGVTMSPHWFHDLHVHRVAATPNARYVEFFADDQVLNFRRLVDNQLQQKDGDLLLPQAPGLGFNFDDNAVKRYALDKANPWTVMR